MSAIHRIGNALNVEPEKMAKALYYHKRSPSVNRLYDYKPVLSKPQRPPRLDRKFRAAAKRSIAEKREIWASMQQHAPELATVFQLFPGSTVLSWQVNGKTIGADYS